MGRGRRVPARPAAASVHSSARVLPALRHCRGCYTAVRPGLQGPGRHRGGPLPVQGSGHGALRGTDEDVLSLAPPVPVPAEDAASAAGDATGSVEGLLSLLAGGDERGPVVPAPGASRARGGAASAARPASARRAVAVAPVAAAAGAAAAAAPAPPGADAAAAAAAAPASAPGAGAEAHHPAPAPCAELRRAVTIHVHGRFDVVFAYHGPSHGSAGLFALAARRPYYPDENIGDCVSPLAALELKGGRTGLRRPACDFRLSFKLGDRPSRLGDVCLCDVVRDVDEVLRADPRRPLTLFAGPSASGGRPPRLAPLIHGPGAPPSTGVLTPHFFLRD